MITMIYACGFRVSELTNLKLENLNFEEMIGYVRQSKGRKDRVFNIPKKLLKKLKKQVEIQKKPVKNICFQEEILNFQQETYKK